MKIAVLAPVVLGLCIAARAWARPDLIALPYTLKASQLSGDGRVVVGRGLSGGAARWTRAGGVELLSADPSSSSTGVSFDGSVVVGLDAGGVFRWSAAGGIQPLGLPPGFDTVDAPMASGDGSMVVGSARNGSTTGTRIWRWTQPGGFTFLPSGFSNAHRAVGVDASGDVIVSDDLMSQYRPGLPMSPYPGRGWLHTPLMSSVLPSPWLNAAFAVSDDGHTVVGERWSYNSLGHASNHRALRWIDAGSPEELGVPPGHTYSIAIDVSADGSVIVGASDSAPSVEPVWVWTGATGMRELKQVLLGLGVSSAANWSLDYVRAVSSDGVVILGEGIFGGYSRPWLADIGSGCYPDCDGDGSLTLADFNCFQQAFAAADPYADCNQDGVRTVQDFGCFQSRFVAGCP